MPVFTRQVSRTWRLPRTVEPAQERLAGRSDQELGLNKLASSTFNLPEHLSAKALQKTDIRWPAPESAETAGYRGNHGRTALLLTEEDLTWMPSQMPQGLVALNASPRSVLASKRHCHALC